jgi:hypothetical protein
MLATRIRSSIAVLFVVAAVSATSLTGVASALVTSTSVKSTSVQSTLLSPPIVALLPEPPKAAGSAGILGYSDNVCQELADEYNSELQGAYDPNNTSAQKAGEFTAAEQTYKVLTDNCLVVY